MSVDIEGSTEEGLDDMYYAILEVITEPMWKAKIQAALEEQKDEQPIDEVPTLQTIGRRVDELVAAGCLESCILSPDELDRDLIIAYRRTEKGTAAITEKRGKILEEVAHTKSIACRKDRTVAKKVLIKLIMDTFDLPDADRERMENEYTEHELLALLALHFAQRNADEQDESKKPHGHSTDDAENFGFLIE